MNAELQFDKIQVLKSVIGFLNDSTGILFQSVSEHILSIYSLMQKLLFLFHFELVFDNLKIKLD